MKDLDILRYYFHTSYIKFSWHWPFFFTLIEVLELFASLKYLQIAVMDFSDVQRSSGKSEVFRRYKNLMPQQSSGAAHLNFLMGYGIMIHMSIFR